MLGARETTPSWGGVMRECGSKPLQFSWFRAAMRLYNSLTKSNSYTMRKVLHADMQLSTRCTIQCWSAHSILSATYGLTQSYIFKQKLQNCEHIDLSRFVVDLRERHMEYWTPYSDMHLTQQQTLYLSPMVCSSYQKGSDHSFALYPSQIHGSHTCLEMPFAVQLVHSDFVFTPYVSRQRHGIKVIPPPVTCVVLMMSKMSSMFFSTAPIPT